MLQAKSKGITAKKERPKVIPVPDRPERKYMSKAEVLVSDREDNEEKKRVEEYKRKLAKEMKEKKSTKNYDSETGRAQEAIDKILEKIAATEKFLKTDKKNRQARLELEKLLQGLREARAVMATIKARLKQEKEDAEDTARIRAKIDKENRIKKEMEEEEPVLPKKEVPKESVLPKKKK